MLYVLPVCLPDELDIPLPPNSSSFLLIPNASASFAFRFAIAHSLLQWIWYCPEDPFSRPVGLEVLRPQVAGCWILPQEHVIMIWAWHGSDSEHDDGAWHDNKQGWCAGKLKIKCYFSVCKNMSTKKDRYQSFLGFPQTVVHGPQSSPWQSLSQWWNPHASNLRRDGIDFARREK